MADSSEVRRLLRNALVAFDVNEVEAALAMASRSSSAHIVGAIIVFAAGRWDRAFELFESACRLNPASANLARSLAFERALRVERLEEAAEIARRAAQSDEPLKWMRARFAVLQRREAPGAGDKELFELGEAILAIEPGAHEVRIEVARLCLVAGENDLARDHVRNIDPFESGDASMAAQRVRILMAAGYATEASELLALARQNFDQPVLDDLEAQAVDELGPLSVSILPASTQAASLPVDDWRERDRRRASQMLDRWATSNRAKPTRKTAPTRRLDPSAVAGFEKNGFVVLPGALRETWRLRWLENAQRRLKDEPERWVKSYRGGLEAYDLSDPSTWTLPRVDLMGCEKERVSEVAPDAWAAIVELLGGEHRVATTTWSDYFVINFGVPGEQPYRPPGAGDHEWHVDAPHDMRWGQLRSALIAFVLFTDIAPSAGGTFLAPGSHKRVAALLGDADGVDMVDRTIAQGLTHECGPFHEITGRAGDVVLAHSLLVHAASPNPSGVARFMGNPLVESTTPLDPTGEAPVERALRSS